MCGGEFLKTQYICRAVGKNTLVNDCNEALENYYILTAIVVLLSSTSSPPTASVPENRSDKEAVKGQLPQMTSRML